MCVRLAQRGNSISKFRASTCGSAGVRVRCVPACHAALRVGARTRSGRGRARRWAYWYSRRHSGKPLPHVKFWNVHVCMLNKRPEGLYHTSAAYSSGPGSRPDRATGRNRLRLRDGVDVPTHGHVAIAGPLPRCPRQPGSRRRRAGASARRPPVDRVQQPHPQHTGPHRTRDREMRDQSQRPTRTSTRRGDASERALNFAFPRPSDNHTATMAAIRPGTTRRQRPSRMCP